ncbi:MAG TPA: GAF domain-containing protein, partial [Spirochaetota bacterium]|nr:GAF domain-containing protein [Spirochaetota bacterium]
MCCIIIDNALKEKVSIPGKLDADIHYIYPPYDELPGILHSLNATPENCNAVLCIVPSNACEEIQSIVESVDKSANHLYVGYVCVGNTCDATMMQDVLALYTEGINAGEFEFIVLKIKFIARQHFEFKNLNRQHLHQLEDTQRDFDALINIGKALSIEKNPDRLLKLILHLSKTITGADAGSIYLVEEVNGSKVLRFKHSHTFSKDLPYEEFTIPMDKNSIAGYVAVTQQVLNIPDVYELGPDDPVAFNSSFDKAHNYRSKSMLVVPMINHINKTIGVIQLINSKEDI